MKTSIATVSISGDLREKLAGHRRRRIRRHRDLRERLPRLRRHAREVGRMVRDAGLEITLFQPFRDFEGHARAAAQAHIRPRGAEVRPDARAGHGPDAGLLQRVALALGGIDRAAADFRELGDSARRGAACASATRPWPGGGTSTTTAMPGRSSGVPITPTSASSSTRSTRWRARSRRRLRSAPIPGDRIFIVQLADAPLDRHGPAALEPALPEHAGPGRPAGARLHARSSGHRL